MSRLFLAAVLASISFVSSQPDLVTLDRQYWERSGEEDLLESLVTQVNTGLARNVILFIGDGMGPNTVTATRIYRGGEQSYLAWERFPHLGALKTYATNKQVPDSASTATSMFTGVKCNYHVIGLDPLVNEGDCEKSLDENLRLTTLATLAQAQGKATGIVTTTRITHATPAAMYAHSPSRKWECDSMIPPEAKGRCKDIGRQLIEDLPGRNFNVILGGGRQGLMANATATPIDPVDLVWYCAREDGRNLIEEWAQDKASRNLKYGIAQNTKTLMDIDTANIDYLLGIFANTHLTFDFARNTSEEGMPSLEQMTIAALKVLMNNDNGFFLMVEGGLIDQAHHRGKARKAIHEVLSFNDAINATMKFLEKVGVKDETLVIVTSDHSHTLTISGYASRGNNILGVASNSKADGVPYTTLTYANSGKENYHYKVNGSAVERENPATVDTTSFEYGVQAAVLQNENTHGGSDVFVYATGPFAHLFHRVHEQNYVANVIKYAAKLGEYKNSEPSSSPSAHFMPFTIFISSLLIIYISIFHYRQ